jgi:hypothetical protein
MVLSSCSIISTWLSSCIVLNVIHAGMVVSSGEHECISLLEHGVLHDLERLLIDKTKLGQPSICNRRVIYC